jgi:hypothetical protein
MISFSGFGGKPFIQPNFLGSESSALKGLADCAEVCSIPTDKKITQMAAISDIVKERDIFCSPKKLLM